MPHSMATFFARVASREWSLLEHSSLRLARVRHGPAKAASALRPRLTYKELVGQLLGCLTVLNDAITREAFTAMARPDCSSGLKPSVRTS